MTGVTRVAFGGECSTLVVYSLDQRKEVLELPVEEVVYDVGVTADALAYANGRRASMYGKGGTQFSWQDQPSFAVLSSLIVTMPLPRRTLRMIDTLFEQMALEGEAAKLKSFELPKAVHLVAEVNELNQGFTIENDCLTPTFKLKRPQLLKKYQKEVDEMYRALGETPAP